MEIITQVLNMLDGWLGSARYFPFVLLGTGLFFTVYLGFPQVRYFRHAWRVVTGRYDKPEHEGDASHFQALTTALSGTVGTGNIGGVALALYLGGPAALFWMWATAFFGMTTKFVEVTLSHKYRVKDEEGFIVGGPMFYMERRLNMKWLAIFFAVATVISSFGSGNLPQSNNMAVGVETTFGIPTWMTGALFAVLLGMVIIGGIRRIVVVTETIVPVMALIYFVGAISVAVAHYDQLLPSLAAVMKDAFTGSAALGGFLGATFAFAFIQGVKRGLFSNEAGQGSAPIAHAAARADEPVSEGMVSLLEPFIDTIVICTLTGLVILSTGVWAEKFENSFQQFDMEYVVGSYSEEDEESRRSLFSHLSENAEDDPVKAFSGTIAVFEGVARGSNGHTVLHNRSIAEKVTYYMDGELYSGEVVVEDGKQLDGTIEVRGYSLVHSVELTTKAFSRGVLGENGKYIVSIGLLLFAFSTAVAWSYYGDRAMTYLFGLKSVLPYRIAYVLGFFIASISDTSLIWLISYITVALMALPNLFAIVVMHKEMKETVNEYWDKFSKDHPDGP